MELWWRKEEDDRICFVSALRAAETQQEQLTQSDLSSISKCTANMNMCS